MPIRGPAGPQAGVIDYAEWRLETAGLSAEEARRVQRSVFKSGALPPGSRACRCELTPGAPNQLIRPGASV